MSGRIVLTRSLNSKKEPLGSCFLFRINGLMKSNDQNEVTLKVCVLGWLLVLYLLWLVLCGIWIYWTLEWEKDWWPIEWIDEESLENNRNNRRSSVHPIRAWRWNNSKEICLENLSQKFCLFRSSLLSTQHIGCPGERWPLPTVYISLEKDDLERMKNLESQRPLSLFVCSWQMTQGAKGQSITFLSVGNRYISWHPGQPNKVETESQNCIELWPLFVDQMTWLPIVLSHLYRTFLTFSLSAPLNVCKLNLWYCCRSSIVPSCPRVNWVR